MANKKYLVLETSFINGRLVQPGDVVEFNGDAGSNLELVKAEKKSKDDKQGSDKQPEDTPDAAGTAPVI